MSKKKVHPLAELYPAGFGEAVKAQREELQLTQKDLAASCDLDQSYIVRVEGGKQNVTLSTIVVLAIALKLSPSHLLNEATKYVRQEYEHRKEVDEK